MDRDESDDDSGHEELPDLTPPQAGSAKAIDWIVARSEGHPTLRAVDTGFVDLDAALGGLLPGRLVVLAGHPAMGTTTLALSFCEHALCERDRTVLYVSLGQSRMDVLIRLIGMRA